MFEAIKVFSINDWIVIDLIKFKLSSRSLYISWHTIQSFYKFIIQVLV